MSRGAEIYGKILAQFVLFISDGIFRNNALSLKPSTDKKFDSNMDGKVVIFVPDWLKSNQILQAIKFSIKILSLSTSSFNM